MSADPSDAPEKLNDLEASFRQLGYTITPEALSEVMSVLPQLQAMRRRVRRGYDRADEPAHTFSAAESAEAGLLKAAK